MTGYQHRKGIRFEYREQQRQRVQSSPSLARRFQALKALTVLLDYCDPRAIIQNGRVKYSVNVDNAKSVFRFDCRNSECVQGDFDLTGPLAKARCQEAHRRHGGNALSRLAKQSHRGLGPGVTAPCGTTSGRRIDPSACQRPIPRRAANRTCGTVRQQADTRAGRSANGTSGGVHGDAERKIPEPPFLRGEAVSSSLTQTTVDWPAPCKAPRCRAKLLGLLNGVTTGKPPKRPVCRAAASAAEITGFKVWQAERLPYSLRCSVGRPQPSRSVPDTNALRTAHATPQRT